MKTITLDEAYARATKGPLSTDGTLITDFEGAAFFSPDSGRGGFHTAKENELDAALLAHARNVLPNLVSLLSQMVKWDRDHGEGGDVQPSQLIYLAEQALAEAATVEVPE